MSYVLAVDGGGTKTHAILYNTLDQSAFLTDGGATNHEYLKGGFSEVRQKLELMTNDIILEGKICIEDISNSVWGISGLDTSSQHNIIKGFISELGFSSFTLCNDSCLAIKAGTKHGYGICLVSGTGPNTVGLNHKNKIFQIAGQLELTGDFGGGMMIGKAAVRTVYQNLFRYHKDTILMKLFFDLYGISSKYEFMDKVMENSENGNIPIPQLAKLVFDAANLGDEESIKMLEIMGREYALNTKSLVEELDFPENEDLEIVLVGSLFTKGWSTIHIESLSNWLNRILKRPYKLITLKDPPVMGALAWALNNLGYDNPLETAHKCIQSLF